MHTLFDTTCMELFNKMHSSGHCLHDILPPVSSQCYDMRQRAHKFVLPQEISYCLFKELYILLFLLNSINAHMFDVCLMNFIWFDW